MIIIINFCSFGRLNDGRETKLYTIKSGEYSVSISDFGATLQSLVVPDKSGTWTDVLLGFDSVKQYAGDVGYMGAVVGRFANRIENGRFILGGKEYHLFVNNGPNHLHGGKEGFNHKLFGAKTLSDRAIEFSYFSPDKEEGYPGNLEVKVTYTLSLDGAIIIDYYACSDKDTIVNLTNHAYFNLNGVHEMTTVYNHSLWLNSTAFCETDGNSLANGNILATRGTPFDFEIGKKLGEVIESDFQHVKSNGGIDHNFVLNGGGYRHSATLYSDLTGVEMTCFTDQPGVQVYTANKFPSLLGKNNVVYKKHCAVCLETQGYPNATSFEHFPSPVLKSGKIYRRKTAYIFSIR